jgi:hypothetical protein
VHSLIASSQELQVFDPFGRQAGDFPHLPYTQEKYQYRLKVQPFSSGGYEAVVKLVDVEQVARLKESQELGILKKPRTERPPEEREESILSSKRRAKQTVRYKCKEMGANRLLTLTTRETLPDDVLLQCFQKFLYLVHRAIGEKLLYVAVPEQHPTNPDHLHLHIAVNTFLNVNIIRKCWHAALVARLPAREDGQPDVQGGMPDCSGSNSPGNVDIQYIKVRGGKCAQTVKVARYISKYITKGDFERFNKKRYWSTKGVKVLDARRLWLKSMSLGEAITESYRELGFFGHSGDGMEFFGSGAFEALKNNSFASSDGMLFWFQITGDSVEFSPPF